MPVVDGPACFPTSGTLHKKEVDYYSYEIYVENAGNVEVKPSAEGQPSTQVIIEKLIFNDPNQLKHLVKEILEEKLLKDDQITHFKEVYTTNQDGGAENPIEIDPSSITSCASNRPEVIEKDTLIKEIKESTDDIKEVVLTKKTTIDEDNILHTICEMKITKWTVIKPCCRLNTVMLVIMLFLCIATAIFILFYEYVLKGSV